jgi:hypothetical protein
MTVNYTPRVTVRLIRPPPTIESMTVFRGPRLRVLDFKYVVVKNKLELMVESWATDSSVKTYYRESRGL